MATNINATKHNTLPVLYSIKPWTMQGTTSQQKTMETEQPLYYHMHVGTITVYLSLALCGQLGSSNQSSLFILSYQQPVTYTFIIDLSVFTYDSSLSFLVISVQCYIGPCGVLVPTGRVHSNNEFEFEFEFIKSSTVILLHHQHYIYRYIAIYIYTYFRNLKTYDGGKMKPI